jgi:hypothetical protein
MPPTYSLVAPIFNEEAVISVLLKRVDVLLEALDAPAELWSSTTDRGIQARS